MYQRHPSHLHPAVALVALCAATLSGCPASPFCATQATLVFDLIVDPAVIPETATEVVVVFYYRDSGAPFAAAALDSSWWRESSQDGVPVSWTVLDGHDGQDVDATVWLDLALDDRDEFADWRDARPDESDPQQVLSFTMHDCGSEHIEIVLTQSDIETGPG